MYELERYRVDDEQEQLTVLEKMSVENFNQNHEIGELRDGTKRFAVRLNQLPLENRPLIEGTLKYALARWKQLENRLKKEPLLAKQFTEKFEDLLEQGTIAYEGTLKDLKQRFETTQPLDEEKCSIASPNRTFSTKTIVTRSGLHKRKYSFIYWWINFCAFVSIYTFVSLM